MRPAKNPATPAALMAYSLVAEILIVGFMRRKRLKAIEKQTQD